MPRGDNFRGQKPAGSGRKKGTPNKVTQSVKDAVVEALNSGDGATAFFIRLKEDDPRTFATVCAKMIPSEVQADVTSRDDSVDLSCKEMTPQERYDVARRMAVTLERGLAAAKSMRAST
jgi:hypothetical protein